MTHHVPPRLCPPDEIRCPACGSLQHHTHVGEGTHLFRLCTGKRRVGGGTAVREIRCSVWLFVIRSGRLCVVSAITEPEKDELVRLLEHPEVAA